MRTVCIIPMQPSVSPYDGKERSLAVTVNRFREIGLTVDHFFHPIDSYSAGLITTRVYDVDGPERQFIMHPRKVGSWLAHRFLWAALLMQPDTPTLVVEDDASFEPTWKDRFEWAVMNLGANWDMLFVGSCCTEGRVVGHVGGELYDVRYPLCTHAYCVRGHSTLRALMSGLDRGGCYAPIDVAMMRHCLPSLKVLTILPRLAGQSDVPNLAP